MDPVPLPTENIYKKPKGKKRKPAKPKKRKPVKKTRKSKRKPAKRAKARKRKARAIVRTERLDMRLTKAEKAKVNTVAKKRKTTVTGVVLQAIGKLR